MAGPPAHIHLKDNCVPKARHNPIPIPLHFKEKVKTSLDRDVEKGIISPVPIGTPTDWCSTMVITAKQKAHHAELLITNTLTHSVNGKLTIHRLLSILHYKSRTAQRKLSLMQLTDTIQLS